MLKVFNSGARSPSQIKNQSSGSKTRLHIRITRRALKKSQRPSNSVDQYNQNLVGGHRQQYYVKVPMVLRV